MAQHFEASGHIEVLKSSGLAEHRLFTSTDNFAGKFESPAEQTIAEHEDRMEDDSYHQDDYLTEYDLKVLKSLELENQPEDPIRGSQKFSSNSVRNYVRRDKSSKRAKKHQQNTTAAYELGPLRTGSSKRSQQNVRKVKVL